MQDLTGANTVAYLRRVIEDTVNRSPRFIQTLGKVSTSANNIVQWNDTQVSIKDISDAGNRLSPDYFICKEYGRAIKAKIQNKDGLFVEWVQEIDPTRQTPVAGVYYLNVDSVDVKTNAVGLTLDSYRWVQGKVKDAQGSIVYLAPGIDGTTLTAALATSPATPLTTAIGTGDPAPDVDILLFPRFLYLLKPTPAGLQLFTPSSPPTPLNPIVDYWYQVSTTETVVASTAGGKEIVQIPTPFISFTLEDETGYVFQATTDYTWYATAGWVELSPWTPPGSTIKAILVTKANPLEASGTNPENILNTGITGDEALAEGQVLIYAPSGLITAPVVSADGTITLPNLLLPGETVRWELRVSMGKTQAVAKKYNLNENVIPGLRIAIGDNVFVDDQVAIIISPTVCETYEIYGSKSNLDINIEVRSNDLQTSSDISELLKQQLLIEKRAGMERDGITIFEMRRSYQGVMRDQSGTAPQFVYTLNVSAMADWKFYRPLVTRLVDVEVQVSAYLPTARKIVLTPETRTFGNTGFVQSYS